MINMPKYHLRVAMIKRCRKDKMGAEGKEEDSKISQNYGRDHDALTDSKSIHSVNIWNFANILEKN